MDRQISDGHLERTLGQLSHGWQQRRRALATRSDSLGSSRTWTIAVSREAGAQGTEVGQAVGRRLGWTVYDHELMERIAQDMGVQTHQEYFHQDPSDLRHYDLVLHVARLGSRRVRWAHRRGPGVSASNSQSSRGGVIRDHR